MVAVEDGSVPRSGILVLGSLVMDRKFFAAGLLERGAGRGETVWSMERHHGGVGRNVATNAARLGHPVTFAGLSGFGADAAELEGALTRLGLALHVRRVADGVGRFDVTLDARGSQISSRIALPDPALGKALCGPELAARIATAGAVVMEGGLDEELLVWVSQQARRHAVPVCCLPTRQADFGPRAHLLPRYDVLVLNTGEAGALLGRDPGTPTGPAEQAELLMRRGPGVVVVTDGARGAALAVATAPGPVHLPAEPGVCTDDTGAGDALASALVAALAAGRTPRDALAHGLRAARVTIACPQSTCHALSSALVHAAPKGRDPVERERARRPRGTRG
ncbi:PfkB family carbohydrate kinase [Streptomyces sp. NBS 14/10]|uniref:carbohydrate kinase family protein n=1 Tax=Streptomyces sp. NBS 14/10 TaxID=1945643 RepID=UPI000B7DF7D2|nr:PfkB family carbohydrate kinase [Streptomyces sp. NBS 14/10]KAK1184008.1 PfkB family carbohydrate kinase [Streptomyces sp. NBS 14/10]